ncbi:MAG: hypothetical protein IPL39_15045 [Opitutaceae bacterium]|nr:hypothetical protein [Opitutaceae bacterium]
MKHIRLCNLSGSTRAKLDRLTAERHSENPRAEVNRLRLSGVRGIWGKSAKERSIEHRARVYGKGRRGSR